MEARQVYEIYCEVESQIKSLRSGITKLTNAFHAGELLNYEFSCTKCHGSKQRREKRKHVYCECEGVDIIDVRRDQALWNTAAYESDKKVRVITDGMKANQTLLELVKMQLLHKESFVPRGKVIIPIKKDYVGQDLLCKWNGISRSGNKCLLGRKADKFDSEDQIDNIWLWQNEFISQLDDESVNNILRVVREKFSFQL